MHNNNHYFSELFLEALENNGDKLSREFVRSMRIYIKSPDFAELLNFLVAGAMGNKIRIKRSVFENAIECIIKCFEKEIENNKSISDKEKAKLQMKANMQLYRVSLENYIKSNFLFE